MNDWTTHKLDKIEKVIKKSVGGNNGDEEHDFYVVKLPWKGPREDLGEDGELREDRGQYMHWTELISSYGN